MPAHLLILAGTTEATALARRLAGTGIMARLSFAGRVEKLAPQPLPSRIGGFGGPEGLASFIRAEKVTHVVDATHPFAARMSHNAVLACTQTDTRLLALSRPPWHPCPGDNWNRVPDMAGAVDALDRPAERVFLAVGRMHLAEFARQPQHRYLLRLVDPPQAALPLPDTHVVVARGPFDEDSDLSLMTEHGIRTVVSKNAGGEGARAKITAARKLGLEVIMIDRPSLPDRPEVHSPEEVIAWLAHSGTDLGV